MVFVANARSYQPSSGFPTALENVQADIYFAGLPWRIREVPGEPTTVGSFSEEHVWVDWHGDLHLRLSQDSTGEWRGAELSTVREGFGYGTYSWTVVNEPHFHPNVVLGLYTWGRDDPANNEIDIEITSWSDPSPERPHVNYTAYEPEPDGDKDNPHVHQFQVPPERFTTHEFTWRPGEIVWRSYNARGELLGTFTAPTPLEPGRERVHMNLWITGGQPPDAPVEVVITDFTFTP